MRRPSLRILHAIHDFLPRHRAGSEVYAANLCRELAKDHQVWVLAAEYDPTRRHGSLAWRVHEGLAVIELVNNWRFRSFEDTYQSPELGRALEHVLRAVGPDVVHVHNLLNLSFDLPKLAKGSGVPVVATLHDYTLVCPSGGQRVHQSAAHLCRQIEPDRCARCFTESPFFAQMALGRLHPRLAGPLTRVARVLGAWAPSVVPRPRRLDPGARARVTRAAIQARLDAARRVFDDVDLFVSPSASLASEFVALGLSPAKLRVRDYGFPPVRPVASRATAGRLRIGYVGTIVWHKGVHLLVDAVRPLPRDSYEVRIHGDLRVAPDYVADLQRRAAGLPVHFLGPFRGDLASIYGDLDLLVVPSLWLENSPLVIHEAFMAGLPVVASNLGGIPDLVTHARNGLLFDPASVSSLTSILSSLITQPSLVEQLARGISPVTPIDEDAHHWNLTYRALVGRRPGTADPP